jgi:tetratricopeptide (TPR) repeat protein
MRGILNTVLALAFLTLAAPAAADQNDPRLPDLFSRLQKTDDLAVAKAIEQTIWGIWTRSGDEAIDREMKKGLNAMDIGNAEAALAVFNSVVKKAPGFAEGWNKRATIYYYMNRYEASIRDVEKTLALEPRHFGALAGLGSIYLETGKEQDALKALEKALAVHPHLIFVQMRVDKLKKKFLGTPI